MQKKIVELKQDTETIQLALNIGKKINDMIGGELKNVKNLNEEQKMILHHIILKSLYENSERTLTILGYRVCD